MKNSTVRNLSVLALFTSMTPLLLFGMVYIFWPYSFHHIGTRMLPLTASSLLFLTTANLLSYIDIKISVHRVYNYILNFVALSFPLISFAFHSNVEALDGAKVLYEYQMAAFNIVIALLLAEATRIYFKHYEKMHGITECEVAEEEV